MRFATDNLFPDFSATLNPEGAHKPVNYTKGELGKCCAVRKGMWRMPD